uniref:Large ribosomal subunit protein bL32c n=1 Tax=Erythrocystis saccata TaxID=2822695 RepID=A0A8E6NSX4_9FLOR|nr:ribosomal protein L32 [Erythrocystis saccata]
MAVPKKRTSRSKSKSRKSIWINKASRNADKALSLAKSLMTGKSTSFIYSKSLEDYK